MKNKNIIKAFEAINSTNVQKELMLENILQKKNKNNFLPFYKILLPLTVILIIFTNNTTVTENTTPSLINRRMEKLEFTYKNKCYIEENINIGKQLKQLGITTKLENKNLYNTKIYKDENNTTILQINDNYITFIEKKCFNTKKG